MPEIWVTMSSCSECLRHHDEDDPPPLCSRCGYLAVTGRPWLAWLAVLAVGATAFGFAWVAG